MRKQIVCLALPLLICGFAFAGCGGNDSSTEGLDTLELDRNSGQGQTTVTDQLGRQVVVGEEPRRLVSLSPSNTEIAFALGLGERLVGVTDFCDYPPAALEVEKVGGFQGPNVEIIVELEPDLIIASTIHSEAVPRLEELGLAVLVIESANLEDLFTSIGLVAGLTGTVPAGEALVASLQERVAAVEEVVETIAREDRVKVYYEIYSDPLMSVGSGAFIHEIITVAGGINIFGDLNERYPQVSAEVVAESSPGVILFPDDHGTAEFVVETMIARPGWESVPALVEQRYHSVNHDHFARPGPRVVEAIEHAARLFYPELF